VHYLVAAVKEVNKKAIPQSGQPVQKSNEPRNMFSDAGVDFHEVAFLE